MYTLAPFFSYCSATLQSPSLKITTRCHSVFSLRSPVPLSRHVSDVAMLRLAIGRPSWVRRISGSLPRLPTRITLFTLPAITTLPRFKSSRTSLHAGRSTELVHHIPFGRTLYASRARHLPSGGLSTYSAGPANVPDLFRISCTPK